MTGLRLLAQAVRISLAAVLLASTGAQAGDLIGSSREGAVFQINQTTGRASFLCVLPAGTTEIEYDNSTGLAFFQLPDGAFLGGSFDIATCAAGPPVFDGHSFTGLEYVGADLYGATIDGSGGPSSLRILDTITGTSKFIGLTGVGPISGLAYDATTGVMYGIAGGGGPANLYTVDLSTGAASVIGSTGIQAGSLEFGDGGRLFAGGTGSNAGELWEIDPATAAATFIGDTGFPSLTGLAMRLPLDHFMSYKVKQAKDAPRFPGLGPIYLADQFGSANYDVLDPRSLLLPAAKNGEPIGNGAAHLEDYKLRRDRRERSFVPRKDVRVVNQCSDLFVEVSEPHSLLVPTAKRLDGPATSLGTPLDHFLCYKAKVETELATGDPVAALPKGIQVDVSDQFQTRRYDLKKLTRLCNPVAKSGNPVYLAGPAKGTPVEIAPATIRNPNSHLVCYKARLAKRSIAQNGCGPVDPDDRGTRIAPPQPKHQQRRVFVANQLGSGQLDTVGEVELCIPSEKNPICGNAVLEPYSGEQCDDGNVFDGDGCSATCVTEFCGDGIAQFAIGEQCDGDDDFSCPGECDAQCQCPPPPCAHGVCETGAPLSPITCEDPCVDVVCDEDPFCCEVFWDQICVDEARELCGACAPYGSPARAFLESSSTLLE